MTFEAETFTALGTPRTAVPLPGELFDGTINMPVMHQAVKAFRANQRQGNAATKIRKFVTGGNQKPWKQKGTGRARQGSTRAPQWVGGGTVFGPTPRSYAQYVPRQVRALARKSALNARASEGAVKVIDAFNFDAPHTRRVVELLAALGAGEQKVLILTDGAQPNVYLSGRNLPLVQVLPYSDVSTYHILWSDLVLIEASAIGQTLEPVVETGRAVPARKVRAATHGASRASGAKHATTGSSRAAGAAKAAKKAAKKAAAKKATKKAKPAAKAKRAVTKSAKKSASAPAAKKRPAAKKAAPKKKRS
jgi:large subunit ribosomal protein L4